MGWDRARDREPESSQIRAASGGFWRRGLGGGDWTWSLESDHASPGCPRARGRQLFFSWLFSCLRRGEEDPRDKGGEGKNSRGRDEVDGFLPDAP